MIFSERSSQGNGGISLNQSQAEWLGLKLVANQVPQREVADWLGAFFDFGWGFNIMDAYLYHLKEFRNERENLQ